MWDNGATRTPSIPRRDMRVTRVPASRLARHHGPLARRLGCCGGATHYVYDGNVTWPTQVAVRACVGLRNRHTAASAFLLRDLSPSGIDRTWLRNVYNTTVLPPLEAPAEFLEVVSEAAAGRYIKYSATAQQALLPSITTLAGVQGQCPDAGARLPITAKTLAFDATTVFASFSALEATRYVYERYVNETTGLAKMNPGYEKQSGKHIINPSISSTPRQSSHDYIVFC